APVQGQTLRYVVEPSARAAGMDLRVTMTFPGESSGRTRVVLPRDRFGVPDMHRFVRDVEVVAGGARAPIREDSVVFIEHRPGAEVSVRYTVRYDSATVGFVAYGPSVSPRHYHFLGSQWMARVGPPDSVRRFEVRVERGSLSGPVAGSFGIGPGTHAFEASFDELDWSVIAAGAYREDRFACEGRPVATLVHGSFEVPDDTLFAMARKIVCGEREVFADHAQPFYSIIITERDRLRAGASFLNAFAAFLRPDSDRDQLVGLLAHEMMHVWLPRKLRLVPGPDEKVPAVEFSWFHDIRYDWFHEGFTEYLSRRLLIEVGLVSEEWFVERLNADLERLAIHPYRALSVFGLEDAARSQRYSNWHQRLSYLRGAILAFNWDAAIRRSSGGRRGLIDAVRRLLAAAEEERIPRPRFERLLEEMGVPAREDVELYALHGRAIPVDSLGMGPGWVLEYRSVPAFEPGFDLVVSLNADTVIGVREGGPAFDAGLRDGMPIVRTENAWRWDEEWRAGRPMIVVVRDGDGERPIEFFAGAGEVRVPHFVRRD
ncbi:MAG: hypothetical protein ACRELC_02370, partial [Gemmatimonadota bacterium]